MFYIESDAHAFGQSRVNSRGAFGPTAYEVIMDQVRAAGRMVAVWRVKFIFG